MLRVAILFCVAGLAPACGSEIVPLPTLSLSPSLTPVRLTRVEALVVSAENPGPCISGAAVEVVDGQSLGSHRTLTDQCDIWSDAYGGEATFTDLMVGVPMTLRASAQGYSTQEKTVVPSWPVERVIFELPSN